MASEDAARAVTRAESVGSLRLWIGALGGAAAWLGHIVTNYSLEEWFACAPSAQEPGQILGFGVETVSIFLNLLFLAIAAAAAIAALSCWRSLRKTAGGDEGERAEWMAGAGFAADVVFIAMIVWGFAPPLILGVCQHAP